MYKSFAIWHEIKTEDTNDSDLSIELHFNLWKFSSKKESFSKKIENFCAKKNKSECFDCLDVGIMVKEIRHFSSISIFVPFSLAEEKIRDLGETIAQDSNLLTAIFNEFSKFGEEKVKLQEVCLNIDTSNSSNENTDKFDIYLMEPDNFKLEEITQDKMKGTIVTIDTSNIKCSDKAYLRFRIDLEPQNIKDILLYQDFPKDSLLQSSTDKKEFLDFRLNETRSLPNSILEKYGENFINIKKIHFFLMREYRDEMNMSNPVSPRYRVLEDHTWSNYFKKDKPNLKLGYMLAYHWKFTPEENKNKEYINNLTLSTKFSFKESSIFKVVLFVLLSLSLGAIGGIAGNFATDIIRYNIENNSEK
jgi:hypothetical protein